LVGGQDEKLTEGIKLYAIPLTATSKRTILSNLITNQRERTLRACSDRWIWSLLGSAVRDPSTWFGWRVPGPF